MSGLPAWARVGAKVVCVNAAVRPEQSGPKWTGGLDGLVVGELYTIRAVGLPTHSGDIGVYLTEIRRGVDCFLGVEAPYDLSRFRPLVEDKSDNEIEAQIYHKKGLHQSVTRKSRERA